MSTAIHQEPQRATALYMRQSLNRDHNKVSVPYQREALHKMAAEKDWGDVIEYVDDNISAKAGSKRPRFDELCHDIRDGLIERVAVWDDDRLRRTVRDGEDFIDLADKHRVELANVSGPIDLSTPEGRMFFRVKGTVASFEIEHKSKRQKAANRYRAKQGKPWVERTFGYDGNDIVEHEADAIRKASRALLNGASLWSIAQEWNSQGLRTAKGYTWAGSQVRQVLMRASNAGLQVYDGQLLDDVRSVRPAIVKRQTWELVCKVLADPKRHTGRSPGRKHRLSGIALCAVCKKPIGSGIRGTQTNPNRVVYQCKRVGCMKIVRDLVQTDEVVLGVITERLAQPDAAAKLCKPTVDTAALHQKINDLSKQIAAAEHDYDEGLIDAKRMNARIERVNEKLEPLHNKLFGSYMSADVKKLAGNPDAADLFEELPLDRQRSVIDQLVVVTIEAQKKKGGRFEKEAITVDWR